MDPLLEIRNLKKYFPLRTGLLRRVKKHVRAVDDVSFFIGRGEIFGLVGESGSGKSTLGKVVLRLLEPTAGEIIFEGKRINDLSPGEMRLTRRSMQMVFQDPMASLNPRMPVKRILERPLQNFGLLRENSNGFIRSLLERVGMGAGHLDCYPHELSGGQQQRVGIARALSLHPKLVVLDEPTSSLDVSVQSQIVKLLLQLQDELRLSYLFISHNLSLVRFMSHRIAVMYLGRILEMADGRELFEKAAHPYTRALISAIPGLGKTLHKRIILEGSTPHAANLNNDCRFRTRCSYAAEVCKSDPDLKEISPHHFVACHLFDCGR